MEENDFFGQILQRGSAPRPQSRLRPPPIRRLQPIPPADRRGGLYGWGPIWFRWMVLIISLWGFLLSLPEGCIGR